MRCVDAWEEGNTSEGADEEGPRHVLAIEALGRNESGSTKDVEEVSEEGQGYASLLKGP
jgi:hypothetical protein